MTNLVLCAAICVASWETHKRDGMTMANGQPYNCHAMTCATRIWPIGTVLRVTDTHNGCSVIVRVTDVPAKKYKNRIDLSSTAFSKLNGLDLGICSVSVDIIKP